MAESHILDPTSESAANAQLVLVDPANGYQLKDFDPGMPDLDPLYASSADTEGDLLIGPPRYRNAVSQGHVIVTGPDSATLDNRIAVFQQKIGKFAREGGTYKRITPAGNVCIADVLDATLDEPDDWAYVNALTCIIGFKLERKPFWRGATVDTILDDFSSDSITVGKYTFDTGAGSLSVASAQLTPSTTAEKRLYRSAENLNYADAQATVKVTTGASVASGSTGLILRRLGSGDYLRATLNFAGAGSTLIVEKVTATVAAQLGPASGTFTTATATSYWLRFRCEGNLLTVEYWTAAPTPAGSATASLSYTLAGADATTWGLGISGQAGLRLIPQATDYRWDDFTIDPCVYVEKTNPILVTPPIYGIKGDVSALGILRVNELATLDQWWAIWGNESRYFAQGVPTILEQFGSDTIGSGAWSVANGTVSVAGGLLVPGATTEIRAHRTDAATYTDARTVVKTTTGASVASGSTALTQRRSADTDFLFARLNFAGAASTLTLHKRTAGADSGALATSAAFTTVAATSYWLEFIVRGTALTVNAYATDPATGSAIITGATAAYTLTTTEAAQFIAGANGLKLVPQATDYRWDDFRAQPLALCTELRRNSEYLLLSYAGQTYSGTQSTRAGASTDGTVANHVIRHTLTTAYAASCTTGPLGHVGNYRVFARVFRPTTNTGAVSVAFEWGTGDFLKVTRNDVVTYAAGERQGDFCLVDLGKIQIPQATKGTQQWQGQIVAKSTVLSDVLDIDYVCFVPYQEGSGEGAGVVLTTAPTVMSARDEFDQATGALAGKALPLGGTWVAGGAATTDFNVDAVGHTATRTAATDAGATPATGRFAIAGTTVFTDCLAQVDIMATSAVSGSHVGQRAAVATRYVDASNCLLAQLIAGSGGGWAIFSLTAYVAATAVASTSVTFASSLPAGISYSVRVVVDASGRATAWLFTQGGSPGTPIAYLSATALATGGTLASGKAGIYDIQTSGNADIRTFDNFFAAVPKADAAVFSARQMEFRYDGPLRQDSNGYGPWPLSAPQGDNVRLLPAGRENRQNRIIIDTCRNDPKTMMDPTLSKTQLQLVHTPRYLSIAAL